VVKFSRENNAMFLKVNAKIIRHMTGGEWLAHLRGTPYIMYTLLHGVR
jgi:hypothetical protein